MVEYTKSELTKILSEHKEYLRTGDLSKRANLSGANLYGAILNKANLSGANLYGANLSEANLSRAVRS